MSCKKSLGSDPAAVYCQRHTTELPQQARPLQERTQDQQHRKHLQAMSSRQQQTPNGVCHSAEPAGHAQQTPQHPFALPAAATVTAVAAYSTQQHTTLQPPQPQQLPVAGCRHLQEDSLGVQSLRSGNKTPDMPQMPSRQPSVLGTQQQQGLLKAAADR
jgi:hypothetical protein